jgi:hypothetical protein
LLRATVSQLVIQSFGMIANESNSFVAARLMEEVSSAALIFGPL